jgi:hypothetical protein
VLGVDDHHHDVGEGDVAPAPEEDLERDRLVGGAGGEGVAPREVEDGDAAAVRPGERPLVPVDRDPGEVPDALPQPGEGVEERRLPRVGVPDERDA